MEKNIDKLPNFQTVKKNSDDSEDEDKSYGAKIKNRKKEINSWDCSTPTTGRKTPKDKNNDWDSSSDCHETTVEPFENIENSIANECDNSESEKNSVQKLIHVGNKEMQPNTRNSFDSLDIPLGDLSDSDKSNLVEMFNVKNGQVAKIGRSPVRNDIEKVYKSEEDLLLVEDIEEIYKNDDPLKCEMTEEEEEEEESLAMSDLDSNLEGEKEWSIHSAAEDTTIWMIPKSERTQSTDSNRKLISTSDRKKIEHLDDFKVLLKKSKSFSDMEKTKTKKQMTKSSRSDYEGRLDFKTSSFEFPLKYEGLDQLKKLETDSKNTLCYKKFDSATGFFSEYECRIVTMDKESPENKPTSSTNNFKSAESISNEVNYKAANSSNSDSKNSNVSGSCVVINDEFMVAGPSSPSYFDAVSLPDMGRGSNTERQIKEKSLRRKNGSGKGKNDPDPKALQSPGTKRGNESWFFLDDKGQYREVTKNEVSILLNGKSADAVLQSKKEHVISNTTLPDSPNCSLYGMLTKESLEHFLREDDVGGEGRQQKFNELERKVENTLLYIQPSANLTASIKFIPVDTEMIHIWRTSRDNGSLISSEDDLRLRSSHASVETQRNPNEQQSSVAGQKPQQASSRQPQGPVLKLPTSIACLVGHDQKNQLNHYSNLCVETRMIVDALTNNFTTLQIKLDVEIKRNMALQQQVKKLQTLIKNAENKISSDASRFKGGNTKEFNKVNHFDDSYGVVQSKRNNQYFPLRETVCDRYLYASNPPSCTSTINITASSVMKIENGIEGKLQDSDSETSKEILQELSLEKKVSKEEINKTRSNIGSSCNESDNSSNCVVGELKETNSTLKTNLCIIEEKMKCLEQKNKIITQQNIELKQKLDEISFELEIYLATTSANESYEVNELDTKGNQVCNLKLEQDNLKKSENLQEDHIAENALVREQLVKKTLSLDEWITTTADIFREIETSKKILCQNGILVDLNFNLETMAKIPSNVFKILNSYITETTERLIKIYAKNLLYEQTLRETTGKESLRKHDGRIETPSLNEEIPNYIELSDQCRKGSEEPENKVIQDYLAVIMEKSSLMKEIKLLKTENEMLVESQQEHYEKLKQTMVALKDKKSDIMALESSHKLVEIEKRKLQEVLKLYEEEKENMETEISKKTKSLEELVADLKNKDLLVIDSNEKLKAAANEIKNFEKSCQLKDELINELKMENSQLLGMEGMKTNRIEILKDELNNLEMQKTQLESELTSTKAFLNQTQKEMADYITHLETVINNCQDALDKSKQKLKESNQVISRLKNDNEILDKQHQCDLKLYNKTKDELESSKETVLNISNKFKQAEEEKDKLIKKLEILVNSEKEKSEALNEATRECKMLLNENTSLKEKMEIFSKDKDESLKEQKDLINKYAMLSKEVQKLQEKYRNVKAECNERTNLIKYLEMMLKENLLEYNNRIICLEKNISHVLDKIAACKNCMREKHVGGESEVRELRHQLDVTFQEKKDLEIVVNNYYSALKHLENEVYEKEKKVDELHVKLSLEQQKTTEGASAKKSCQGSLETPQKSSEFLQVEKLEKQILERENELLECRKQLQQCEMNHGNEKKKLELNIADLKSEISRYQIRIDVMMRNFPSLDKNFNNSEVDKRNVEDTVIKLNAVSKEVQEKDKKIMELNEIINNYKLEIKMKESVLENSHKKSFYADEDMKSQFSRMQNALTAASKNNEIQQKEKDEMADKLLQSVKLIMEERSARQTIEKVSAEKEKNMKEQVDHTNNELALKVKECETLTSALEKRKKLIIKLQNDIRKMKLEISSLKAQVVSQKKANIFHNEIEETSDYIPYNEELLFHSTSLTHMKRQNVSPERLDSCIRQLKETRNINLQLRKTEGQYQAKIVCLEDEIRDARLLIKELQGDIKTEKKSKKALKDMIMSAKMEIEACLLAKQLILSVADRINRHLNLSEIPSRELLSDFRLRENANLSTIF